MRPSLRFGKLLLLSAIAVGLPGSVVCGQEKKPVGPGAAAKKADPEKAEKRRPPLPAYFRNVVDDKQREAVYKIQEEYAGKITALKTQLEALTKERDAKTAAVLTPEQRKKIEQLQAESKGKRAQKAVPAQDTQPSAK